MSVVLDVTIRDAELDPPEVESFLFDRSGRLAFDIGGNNGRVARHLASRFEHVVSCEPAEESYARLSAVDGVTALQVAVSDHTGVVTLAVQAEHIKSGQLTSPTSGGDEWILDRAAGGGGWGQILAAREVPCRTVDDLAAEFGDPDFIKCDVEGHEGRVFAGALGVLERARPALYIEIHNDQLGQEVSSYLSDFYDNVQKIKHPYYKKTDFGADNHYWLISDKILR